MRKKRLLGFCVMLFLTLNALAQSLTVKGKITDEKGAAIAGATIWHTFTLWGLSKKFLQSEEKKFGIGNASLIGSKEFYF